MFQTLVSLLQAQCSSSRMGRWLTPRQWPFSRRGQGRTASRVREWWFWRKKFGSSWLHGLWIENRSISWPLPHSRIYGGGWAGCVWEHVASSHHVSVLAAALSEAALCSLFGIWEALIWCQAESWAYSLEEMQSHQRERDICLQDWCPKEFKRCLLCSTSLEYPGCEYCLLLELPATLTGALLG